MITVCIPAYNEEKRLRPSVENTIAAAKKAGNVTLDIIIVNDASTDRTPQVIKTLEKKYSFVRSLQHKKNSGIGTGFQEALRIARYEKFMIVPGDNDAAPKLLEKLMRVREKAEVVMSFYMNTEARGRFRNIISTLYGLLYLVVFGVYVQYLNGVSIYPTAKLRKLNLRSKRFSITAEVNTKLLCSGCTFFETPGYMQTGTIDSTSLTAKNLMEVVKTFLFLTYEIKIARREMYSKPAIRVQDE